MNKNTASIKKILLYALFVINLICILFLWWQGSSFLLSQGVGSVEIAFGRVCGLISEYLILVQLVLIGRVKPVEKLYGHDKLNKLHRLNGKTIPYILTLHPILLILGYSTLNQVSVVAQFFDFINNWQDVYKALIGFLLVIFVVIFSLVIIRKKLKYETWYGTHLLVYVAIFLFFGHQTNTGDLSQGPAYYYWFTLNFFVFGIVLLYRFIRPLYIYFKHQFYVEKIVEETPDIYSVYIRGKNMNTYNFQAGQFANLMFLTRKTLFSHPFSFSSAYNGEYLRFSVKVLGNYTGHVPHIKPGTKVLIDGPLGAFTEAHAHTSKYLLIAGGIGITPVNALAQSLAQKNADTVLMYSFKASTDSAFVNELKTLSITSYFLESQVDGRITFEKIKEHVPDIAERDIYICGPQEMIKELSARMLEHGIPARNIHFELFEY